jgi:hypothetical protein
VGLHAAEGATGETWCRLGALSASSFSVRTFREALDQAHLSRTDPHFTQPTTWHFAELLVAVAAAASADVVDLLLVEVCSLLGALHDFSANARQDAVVSEELHSDLQTLSSVSVAIQQSGKALMTLLEMGKFVHDCENEMFCESINTKIPYFNAPIYLENKVHILRHGTWRGKWADPAIDTHWQSRRNPRPVEPGLLHHQASRGHTSQVLQSWRQVLHRRRQAAAS